ncbi:putative Endonuclease/exonuclease/phosphatase domain-containing protein [Seiridium cardinale]|uniref:Endonuclease/exonuclease/phosphatase domain-containing protein n=1 Tax=Seiridium cardinale TaxID=138064 RepID=A0ABR2XAK7_9PEZI
MDAPENHLRADFASLIKEGAPPRRKQDPGDDFQVWQVNLKNSQPDVIAFQDPPDGIGFFSLPGYTGYYGASRGLTEDNNPKVLRDLGWENEIVPIHHVRFFVAQTISRESLEFRYANTAPNHDKGAILDYRIARGQSIHITNVYNIKPTDSSTKVDFDALVHELSLDGFDLLLGDWNMHIEGISSGARNKSAQLKQEALRLNDVVQVSHLGLLTPPFLVTWTGSDQVDRRESTIDLAWGRPLLVQKKTRDSSIEPLFTSDHRIIAHHFDISVEREYRTATLWSSMDRATFRNTTLSNIHQKLLRYPSSSDPVTSILYSISQVNEIIEILDSEISKATEDQMPVRHRRPQYDAMSSPQLNLRRAYGHQARTEYEMNPGHDSLRYWRQSAERLEQQQVLEARRRGERYRVFVASGKWTHHQLARMARKRHQPAIDNIMPALREDKDSEAIYATPQQKTDFLGIYIWPRGGFTKDPPTEKLEVPLQQPSNNQPAIGFNCEVTPLQVSAVLCHLPIGKDAGISRVRSEA